MATLSLVMKYDPPKNNIIVDGLDRDGVEAVYSALHAHNPELFPAKVFSWQQPLQPDDAPFNWPTQSRYITQLFGANSQYYAKFGLSGHEGLDIGVRINSDVRAIGDGVVYSTKGQHENHGNHLYGKQVRIDHCNGYKSIYAYLSKARVRKGDKVSSGDLIAMSGNTGNSTGPHLHITIKHNGEFVDPLPLLKGKQKC
ncbi:MAG: M23 family metallopeptidase [Anaerolineaceae bacterium]|nr:M23 family metallopeptidase [Anaerolineaceae bacterium]